MPARDDIAPAGGAERRVEERLPYRSSATVIAGGQQFQIRTLDLSRSGVCVVASINPPSGLRFRIRMRIDKQPGGGAVTVETEVAVVHSVLASQLSGFRIGLRFMNPNIELTRAVEHFLGSQSAKGPALPASAIRRPAAGATTGAAD
ncbi:MAG: PilZ domain-containing protein [Rubrivivax sp.]|nr:MAG: PilZ domain-containing protein [Rubrivivax sp.]